MKMTTDFALLIRDFMTRYLVATRNVSQNTVLLNGLKKREDAL